MPDKLTVTVRKSQSVVNDFNVYLEKGKARTRMLVGVSEREATEEAKRLAALLQIEMRLYTLHPDLQTVQLRALW